MRREAAPHTGGTETMNGPAVYRVQPPAERTMHHAPTAQCCECNRTPARYLTIEAGDRNYQHRCKDHAAAFAAAHGLVTETPTQTDPKTVNIKTASKRNPRKKEVK